MKQKISWDLTIGSHWPEREYPSQILMPRGGTLINKKMEYETDGKDPWKDALDTLKAEMGDTPYHIWYWYNLD